MNSNFVTRKVFGEIADHLSQKEVTVITGARQTGKTTLFDQLKAKLKSDSRTNDKQILSFNLDLIQHLGAVQNQTDFIKYLNEQLVGTDFLYVFIDEIQRLESPGQFLKGVYDLGLPIKLIVTGSSSLEIKSKVFESLTGRKRVFHLWPFSFSEYATRLEPTLVELSRKDNISTMNRQLLLDRFYEFAIYGGYPRVSLAPAKDEKIAILEEIYSSYVEKDIVNFMNVRNPFAFTKLTTLLGDQAGNLINVREVSNTIGINTRTVESYLSALEQTFIISLVRPFFTNIRKELSKMPKLYFIDTGIRNMAVKYFAGFQENRDKGPLFENFVYAALVKDWRGPIHFWRTKDKREVDFVLRDYHGNIIPVEAKAVHLTRPTVPPGIRSFIERYNPTNAFIVNLALEEEVIVGNTAIRFILPFQIERFFGSTARSVPEES